MTYSDTAVRVSYTLEPAEAEFVVDTTASEGTAAALVGVDPFVPFNADERASRKEKDRPTTPPMARPFSKSRESDMATEMRGKLPGKFRSHNLCRNPTHLFFFACTSLWSAAFNHPVHSTIVRKNHGYCLIPSRIYLQNGA